MQSKRGEILVLKHKVLRVIQKKKLFVKFPPLDTYIDCRER